MLAALPDPFQDGSGRFFRILTTHLFLRGGYSHVPYSSQESVIEGRGAFYALERS